MKKFQKILASLLVLAVMICLPFSVSAQEEPILKLERVVQINDTQLVLEFSEPIVLNKLDPSSNGPFIGVRVVNNKGAVQQIGQDATRVYLQWQGHLSYVDDRHDRLLWTMRTFALDFDSLNDIHNWRGQLADFAEKCEIRLVIEEVPLNKASSDLDGGIFNITTEDGSRNLFATHISGWESAQMPITVNYGYKIDEQALKSTQLPLYEGSVLFDGAEYEPEQQSQPEPEVISMTVVKNDPVVIVAILGGALLVGVAILIITLSVLKKRRKAAK